LVQDRTREQQRIEKLLEDAQIKISAVLSELHGVTARAMMDALISDSAIRARWPQAGRRHVPRASRTTLPHGRQQHMT
jgi:hypothetical protein